MKKMQYKVVGVMSGTSLDGIDLAECEFRLSEDGNWHYKIGKATTVPYSETWRNRLREGIHFSKGRMASLNKKYTQLLGETISTFIHENKIDELDAVCSHGHTILHQPEKGITLQIGNLEALTHYVCEIVVCDFRVQDVDLGGQGAPLVPIGDRLLFGAYDYCLNLGGFANISSEINGNRIAYDVCPVNIVLNRLTEPLGLPYDDGGRIAASGKLDEELLSQLNSIPFYSEKPPKSLGLEWVQKHIFPMLESSGISVEDKLHTFTEHVAIQLSQTFEAHSKVLATGGGAYNTYLLQRLVQLKNIELIVPDNKLLEYKEALVFGLLGVLRLRNEINCLASVTGAKNDHSSGTVFPNPN